MQDEQAAGIVFKIVVHPPQQEFVSGTVPYRAFLSDWDSMVPLHHIESKMALPNCGN